MSAPLLLLLAGSVGLVVDASRGVGAAEQERLIQLTTAALERATDDRVYVENSSVLTCSEPRGVCQERARNKLEHAELVVLVIIGAPTRIRVSAERTGRAITVGRAEVDLPRDQGEWPNALSRFADQLFPPLPKIAPVVEEPPIALVPSAAPPSAPRSYLLPLVSAAAGAALLVTGVVYELKSRSAGDRLAHDDLSPADEAALDDRRHEQRSIGAIALGSGTGLLGLALVLMAID